MVLLFHSKPTCPPPWYPEVLPAMLNATFLQDAKQRFVNLKSIEQRPACRFDGRYGSMLFKASNMNRPVQKLRVRPATDL